MSSLACVPAEIVHTFKRLVTLLVQRREAVRVVVAPLPTPRTVFIATWPSISWRLINFESLLRFPKDVWTAFTLTLPWVSSLWSMRADLSPPETSGPESSPRPDQPMPEKDNGRKPKKEDQYVIQQLMRNPALYDPIRRPRNPIVLCHGLYGFDSWGPSTFQRQYWSEVLQILRNKVNAEVIVTAVPPTGSIEDRSSKLHASLKDRVKGREVNLIAHSMGGLDCRHLLTHIRPTEYRPLSLTTVATPHRGSPFMDWCAANIGVGAFRDIHPSRTPSVPYSLKSPILRRPPVSEATSASPTTSNKDSAAAALSPLVAYLSSLPQSMTTLILSLVDSPAYANLTTAYLNDYFNPRTPDVPGVKYFSIAGRVPEASIFHPLWLPKLILDKAEEVERQSHLKPRDAAQELSNVWPDSLVGRYPDPHEQGNDGLVTVASAKWGEFLGVVEDCDHWDIRGAGGFSIQWEVAGEAGRLGWVRGVDWSKWGMGWWGNSANEMTTKSAEQVKSAVSATPPSNTKAIAPIEDEAHISAVMAWIAEHMGKATMESVRRQNIHRPNRLSSPEVEKPPRRKKLDLERLYLALTRKLYDEGL